ncbi:apolipoprotein N-acyltransferase [Sphingobium sp. AN558]|uniref:apolipoprotein N-acyltransferase n=1 Tax=Sphingobium sp. AN558 TaxID=3133442 RepID=UPI0030C53E1C
MLAILLRHPRCSALLAGFLSAAGFAPLSLWPVTLACFFALLLLIEAAPDRRTVFTRGWLFGLGHFTLGLNWIAHAFTFQDAMPHWFGYGAVILLSLYLAVYPGLAALTAWWANQRMRSGGPLPLILLFAAFWIATEYLRAVAFTGFAWNPLGAVLLPTGVAIASTLIGTYGLGALVVLASGALMLASRRHFASAPAILLPLCVIALWGQIAAAPQAPAGAPRIRVVQPNIGQGEKYSPTLEAEHFRAYAALTGAPRPAPRLIFWPEAAVPAYLDMEPEWRTRLAGLLGPGDLLMTGGDKVYYKEIDKGLYVDRVLSGANNSLWVVTPDARIAARYDKAHLVPYGEYLPMRSILQPLGLSRLVPGDADFWPGPGARSLDLPAALGRPAMKMGVQICYEIIFSGHVVDRANRPAFLFNPSNDAWFGSWGPVQHLAQARLRAIEEGLPIIRSTPTGVSAVIDARGHVRHALSLGRAGFLDTSLPPARPPTLFSRTGNLAPMAFLILLIAVAIATRESRR